MLNTSAASCLSTNRDLYDFSISRGPIYDTIFKQMNFYGQDTYIFLLLLYSWIILRSKKYKIRGRNHRTTFQLLQNVPCQLKYTPLPYLESKLRNRGNLVNICSVVSTTNILKISFLHSIARDSLLDDRSGFFFFLIQCTDTISLLFYYTYRYKS